MNAIRINWLIMADVQEALKYDVWLQTWVKFRGLYCDQVRRYVTARQFPLTGHHPADEIFYFLIVFGGNRIVVFIRAFNLDLVLARDVLGQ